MQPTPQSNLFQDATFARAIERSSADGTWLVVSATVDTDPACREMDSATWRSTDVRKWIERMATAIQIDIDRERDTARMLNVRAVPTTIAFRAGKQEDRIVGRCGATETHAWLESLEKRQTRPDGRLRDSAAAMALKDQRYDDAMRSYIWLWNNVPGFDDYETGWMGVRESFMAMSIASLASLHPPAHEALCAIRDASAAAAPTFDLTTWFGPRIDWLVLNRILRQEDRTLEWFDGVKADPRYASVIEHCATFITEPLKDAQRWRDIGRLYAEPLKEFAFLYETFIVGSLQEVRLPWPGLSSTVSAAAAKSFRAAVSDLCRSLRAAGRTKETKKVEAEALRLDPSEEMRSALRSATSLSN